MDGNPRWKGGIKKRGQYVLLKQPNHPRADSQGYVLAHRIVYEEYYKCTLLPWIEIHHINGIKDDNRPENLQPLTTSQHTILELTLDKTNWLCAQCGGKTLIRKNGKEAWYRNPFGEGHICRNCWRKYKYVRKEYPRARRIEVGKASAAKRQRDWHGHLL